jgi:formyltetrahydrofolate deformylase
VARITGCVADHGGNLLEVSQYTDTTSRWFFARLAIEGGTPGWNIETFRAQFSTLCSSLQADWDMRPADFRTPTVIMVSKQDHCLADLLWRWRSGELPLDLRAVISNHETCRSQVEREGVCFECVKFAADKAATFDSVARLLRETGTELLILARFMQILPDALCREYTGRVINIHHSFLPAFVGANPYRRAFERGVKLIGATCHYATHDLDQGPIIDQQVIPVEHYHDPDDLSRLGRDCERLALARGVRYHIEGRVLVHGNRAIVFRD